MAFQKANARSLRIRISIESNQVHLKVPIRTMAVATLMMVEFAILVEV